MEKMEESVDYCLVDYKHEHYWESIGVITRPNGVIAQVFKCSQCKKCKLKTLEEIVRVFQ